jgi:hypothetical protein
MLCLEAMHNVSMPVWLGRMDVIAMSGKDLLLLPLGFHATE